jgi:hypothetical protein
MLKHCLYSRCSDKRIHTDYMQTVAATGRLSSTNPNLQTSLFVPNGDKKSESIYCRDENYTIISADYSQIELRIIAVWVEENMIKAFLNNEDIHKSTASKSIWCSFRRSDPRSKAMRKRLISELYMESRRSDSTIKPTCHVKRALIWSLLSKLSKIKIIHPRANWIYAKTVMYKQF